MGAATPSASPTKASTPCTGGLGCITPIALVSAAHSASLSWGSEYTSISPLLSFTTVPSYSTPRKKFKTWTSHFSNGKIEFSGIFRHVKQLVLQLCACGLAAMGHWQDDSADMGALNVWHECSHLERLTALKGYILGSYVGQVPEQRLPGLQESTSYKADSKCSVCL